MYNIIYYFLKLLSYLPFWFLYLVSDFIYLIIYHIVKYRIKVVTDNINNSFPEKTYEEKQRIIKGFYRHFADMFVETLKSMSISKNEIQKRMKYIDCETLLKHYDEGKSVILINSHLGNWEWYFSFSLILPKDKPLYQVYKKLTNETTNKIVYNIRKRFGGVNVEMNDLLRTMVDMKKNNQLGMYGLISDQSPQYTPNLHFVDFLNQKTSVITGTEQLSKKFDLPVYYVSLQRIKRGHYEVKVKLISENPKETQQFEITEKYMKFLEEDIHRTPEIWLWSHKRWKHKLNKS